MKYTDKQLANVFIDLALKDEKNIGEVANGFIKYLGKANELHRVKTIILAIERVWKERFGAATITINTAHPISNAIRSSLEKIAQGAEIKESVDAELIGGARVRIDDKIIDGSIAGHLRELKKLLAEA